MGLIYKATSPSGKVYVGKTTKTLTERKMEHFYNIRHKKSKFYDALNSYGFDNFVWEVVEDNVPEDFLNDKERHYIKTLNAREYGYNMTEGGDGVFGYEILGKKNPFYGKKHTEETKKHLSEVRKGRKRNPESIEKHSKTVMGENNPNYGNRWTAKMKMRMSLLKRKKVDG